ncbi:MAG: PH domain-containing protein [Syntrophobacteraceae bacterium]
MSYIDRNLMDGEHIVYRAKLHWVIFIWPIVWFIVALAFYGVGVNIKEANVRIFIVAIAGMFILSAIITFIRPLIQYVTSEFGITNRRVIVKIGLFRRTSLEVLLNKIEGIQVNQSILGRLVGFGSITVTGTGGTKDPFHNIGAPFEFRKQAQEQIASVQALENR